MSELKLQKLLQLNEKLRQEEELPRVKVSEASTLLVRYASSTPDPLTQPNRPEFADNPFIKKQSSSKCSLI